MRSAFDIKDIVTVIAEKPDGISRDVITRGQVGAIKTVIYDEGADEYSYEVETGDRSCYLYSVNQLRLALDDEIRDKFFSLVTGESYRLKEPEIRERLNHKDPKCGGRLI